MADYFEDDQAAPGRSKPLTLEDQQEKDFCIENAKPENVYYHRY